MINISKYCNKINQTIYQCLYIYNIYIHICIYIYVCIYTKAIKIIYKIMRFYKKAHFQQIGQKATNEILTVKLDLIYHS